MTYDDLKNFDELKELHELNERAYVAITKLDSLQCEIDKEKRSTGKCNPLLLTKYDEVFKQCIEVCCELERFWKKRKSEDKK